MPQIVWTSDVAGAATYFNRRWFEYTGMTVDEAGPDAWHRVVHPDDLPRAVSIREATLAAREDIVKLNGTIADKLKAAGMTFVTPNRQAFRDVLNASSYYSEWKGRFGDKAWATLEKYTGKLG